MDFQGFQNNLPVIVTVLVVIFLLVLSWLSYRRYDTISKLSKFLLSSLRAAALLILFFLFMNPFFKSERTIELAPKIAVFLDNSESTSISKGAYEGSKSYYNLLNLIEREKSVDVKMDYFGFSNSIEPIKKDSLSLNKTATNLSEVVSYINALEDYESAVIISDGIITYGKNPIIEAGSSPIPIYTIGVGDSSKVRDIAILNVSTNSTGFSNTNHIVSVDISQFGFNGKKVSVSLMKDDEELLKKEITLSEKKEIESLTFELNLKESGLNQYTLIVQPVAGEWITSNNKTNFTIDILDSKTSILHIASSVHPDVKTIRSILAEDKNIELTTFNFIGQAISNLDRNKKYDLVIIHGFPSSSVFTTLGLDIEALPTFYLPLPKGRQTGSESSFVLVENQSQRLIGAKLFFNENNSNHPILEDLKDIDFSRLAPVYTQTRSTLSKLDATTLISPQLQGINTNSPLLSILERGNIRRSELHAFGWYKMYLSNNLKERNFVINLLSNIVNWTATDPDNRLLKVSTSKTSYTQIERPIVNASLINENGAIEANATIHFSLENDKNDRSTYTLNNLGDGLYKLNLPALPSGKYNYEAVAKKDSRTIETQRGEFLVSESSTELANTIRNDEILRGISERSNGKFYTYDKEISLWEDLKNQNLLETTTSVEESYFFPVKRIFWFILVLILLASEWLFRKRFSLP